MGFSTALSGLKAASTTLSVTGNNIANSQTAGFKESRAQFGDVYTNSLGSSGASAVGAGARVSSVAQQFKQGNIEPTGNALDLAISGEGFFAMGDLVDPVIPDKPLEATSYTRNGAFHINNAGNVVDDNGRYLLAFKPTGATVAEGFDVGVKLPLLIKTDQGAPTPTTNVDMKLNLNGSAKPAVTPFAFTTPGTAPYIPDPKTYTHTTSITTYDVLGNAHIVSTYFSRTAVPNEWDAYTFIDGRSLQPGTQADPYAIPPVPSSGAVALPEGTITTSPTKVVFDDKGNLTKVSPQGTVGDTARSDAALAKLKTDVANAQVVTDLTTLSNVQINVTTAAKTLQAAVNSEVTIRQGVADRATAALKRAEEQPDADPANLSSLTKASAAADQALADAQAVRDSVTLIADNPLERASQEDPYTALSRGLNSAAVESGYDSYAFDLDTQLGTIDAAVGSLSVTSITQAANSLKAANKALSTNVEIVQASRSNADSLAAAYDTTLTALKAAEATEAAEAAAASAAGKPIARTMNTKVDFGTVDISAINPDLKVANMSFSIDLAGSTQFSTPFTVNDLKQDGLPVGNLTGVDVDKTGIVFAKYSNGFAKPIGQVALARFSSNQDLAKVGNTTWLATSDSGAPIYGAGGDNNFGQIRSSSIENSNVDLSEQLVKLIVAQQAYQANSQTVTTEKTIIDTMLRI